MNIVKSICILVAILSLVTMSTKAVFTSQASVVGNKFSTGIFPTPTPSPSDTDKKVDICHYDNGKDPYHIINISINALEAHLAHGDIYPVPESGCPSSIVGGASVELIPTPTPTPSETSSETPTPTPTPSETSSPEILPAQ